MATYFRIHPDSSNRDIFDPDSRLYNAETEEVEPEEVRSNDILVTMTPEQWETVVASRKQ